jgi:hypothetical protein
MIKNKEGKTIMSEVIINFKGSPQSGRTYAMLKVKKFLEKEGYFVLYNPIDHSLLAKWRIKK